MSETKTRQLLREDIPALDDLNSTGCPLKWALRKKDGSENEYVTEGLDGKATDKSEGIRFYGTFIDGVLIGAVCIGFRNNEEESGAIKPDGFIRTVYTHPDYRRKGYGKELMRVAECAAARFGDDFVSVLLDKQLLNGNEMMVAQRFLSECGYTYEDTVENNDCFGKKLF